MFNRRSLITAALGALTYSIATASTAFAKCKVRCRPACIPCMPPSSTLPDCGGDDKQTVGELTTAIVEVLTRLKLIQNDEVVDGLDQDLNDLIRFIGIPKKLDRHPTDKVTIIRPEFKLSAVLVRSLTIPLPDNSLLLDGSELSKIQRKLLISQR